MEPIRSNFLEAKKALSSIEVRRELGYFFEDDIEILLIEKPNSFGNSPQSHAGLIKLRTINFYDGNGNELQLSHLLESVRNQLCSNILSALSLPIFQTYLISILSLYREIEDQIVEDEYGNFRSNHVKILNLEIDDLDLYDKTLYSNTLETWKKLLNNEIFIIERLSQFPDSKAIHYEPAIDTETAKRSPRVFETRSFMLNPELYTIDGKISDKELTEKLKKFKEALFDEGYIRNIDLRDFARIFKNQYVSSQIHWIKKDPKELFYLIRALYEKKLIVRFKNYWQVTCKCFVAYRKNNTLCTPKFLEKCKPPKKKETLRKLDSLIATLE